MEELKKIELTDEAITLLQICIEDRLAMLNEWSITANEKLVADRATLQSLKLRTLLNYLKSL